MTPGSCRPKCPCNAEKNQGPLKTTHFEGPKTIGSLRVPLEHLQLLGERPGQLLGLGWWFAMYPLERPGAQSASLLREIVSRFVPIFARDPLSEPRSLSIGPRMNTYIYTYIHLVRICMHICIHTHVHDVFMISQNIYIDFELGPKGRVAYGHPVWCFWFTFVSRETNWKTGKRF